MWGNLRYTKRLQILIDTNKNLLGFDSKHLVKLLFLIEIMAFANFYFKQLAPYSDWSRNIIQISIKWIFKGDFIFNFFVIVSCPKLNNMIKCKHMPDRHTIGESETRKRLLLHWPLFSETHVHRNTRRIVRRTNQTKNTFSINIRNNHALILWADYKTQLFISKKNIN